MTNPTFFGGGKTSNGRHGSAANVRAAPAVHPGADITVPTSPSRSSLKLWPGVSLEWRPAAL